MKYVLVTGAGGGMGEAVVQKLSDNGYCVFALDRQPIEKRQNVFPLQVDLCDSDQIEKAFEYVKEKTDKLYAIIHFAGIYMLDSLFEISEQEFTRAFSINVFSAFRVNKIFQPLLKNGSKIIITTSYENDNCKIKIFGKKNKFKITRHSEKVGVVKADNEIMGAALEEVIAVIAGGE